MTQFEKLCREAVERLGLDDVIFFSAAGEKPDVVEDDGTLHVTRRGQRACFDVSNNQNDSARVQNKKTLSVLKALDIKLTDKQLLRVLVKDTQDDGERDCCERCGWDS